MADGGDEAAAVASGPEHLAEYQYLIELGLDARVAGKLEEIYRTGKLVHSELDDRAVDALKEFPVDGAQAVLQQFLESNLEHVSNKSAFLCGVMKTYRQKVRAMNSTALGTGGSTSGASESTFDMKPVGKGPDEEKIKAILQRTGYSLDVTTGQRKYGGPPPGWSGSPPSNGCEIFCGKIPRDVYEDELIPLFEKCGTIWDLRLMMDPLTNLNRGYAFVTFTTPEAAQEAVNKLSDMEMRDGKHLKVNVSVPNLRLFVGNIPKNKGKAELMEEFSNATAGLTEVIIYSSPDDKRKNRGFCFLEYDSHKSASLAKRRLSTGRVKIFGCDIIVDWADPQEEPDTDTMSKVKVLYVRNLTHECTEEKLKEAFEEHGGNVQRVKKIKDYAFVHFDEREDAVRAMDALNGRPLHGAVLEVSLAKPPSDRKKKEEILKARERRLLQQHMGAHQHQHHQAHQQARPGGAALVPVVPAPFRGVRPSMRGGSVPAPAAAPLAYARDFDYDYGYGPYRAGGYDPYYNGYFPYAATGDYYYGDYPARGGGGGGGARGRPSSGVTRGGRGRAGRPVTSERAGSPGGARWRPEGSRGGGGGATTTGRPAHWKTSRGATSSGRGTGKSSSGKSRDESGEGSRQTDESRASGGGVGSERGAVAGGSGDAGVGTWRPDAQHDAGAAQQQEPVWYQDDSYGAQWN